MSYFDDASLAFLPSGAAGKDGKAYSIKPVPVYGAELVTNGDFATDSDWTKGTGWTISGGAANATSAGTGTPLSQSIITGKKYKITYDVVSISQGGFQVDLSYSGTALGQLVTTTGTFTDIITSLNPLLSIRAVGTTTGSIDNVSVKEVLTASGDFDFSRGSNLAATRINSDGLIEKGRENLLLQSNQFDTTWTTTNATLTSGQSGYDGSLDAWELQSSGGTNWVVQLISNNGIYTFSVYAKSGTTDWMRINILQSGGNANNYYDIANGLKGASPSSAIIDDKIESVGNGWYRISIVSDGSITQIRIQTAVSDGNETSVSGDNIYIQSAQLEIGLVSTDYITSGATKGKAGILENTPRFNYGDGASCPSLLLEPSATQLIGYSEYFGDSSWGNSSEVTRLLSNSTSPNGELNAYNIIPTTATGNHTLRAQNLSGFTSGAIVTASFFAKANGYKYLSVVGGFGSSNTAASVFNIEAGEIISGSGTIEDYGNGWYRCVSPITLNATALYCVATILNDSQSGSYAGDGTSGVEVFGFQIEAGTYPTSYIPNHSGGTITRAADACSKTGISNLIGQTEGTMFIDFIFDGNPTSVDYSLMILGVIGSNYISIGGYNTSLYSRVFNSTIQGTINAFSMVAGTQYKVAVAYANNDVVMYVNGTNEGTDTSASIPSVSQIAFTRPSYEAKTKISNAQVYKERLTNSELAALTTI